MKIRTRFSLIVVSLMALSVAMPTHSQKDVENPAKILATAFRNAIEEVQPAVVSISAEKETTIEQPNGEDIPDLPEIFKYFFKEDMLPDPMEQFKRTWQGSGVIISPEGEIVTNVHVVKEAEILSVTLDNDETYTAKVKAIDEETDIALIQLEGEGTFPYATLGDSEQLQVGDWVLAIGNPFGLSQSVSQGIVSAKGRTSTDVPIGGSRFSIKNYIQTTAAINPGNSGGPLINLEGEIVGINNAIQTSGGIPANLGIGFAIPSSLAKTVIESLQEFGRVRRGYIGVEMESLQNSEAEDWYKQEYGVTYGAIVNKVRPKTPAEEAGIKEGDLIIEFDGKKIRDSGALVLMVTQTPVGTPVNLVVMRDGERKVIELTLAERPDPSEFLSQSPQPTPISDEDLISQLLGMKIDTLTPELAEEKGYEDELKGVIVTQVAPGGPASERGIQVDDVIDDVNNKPVTNEEEFEEVLQNIYDQLRENGSQGRVILLRVHRAGSRAYPRFVAPKIQLD